jgi:hypothetical protein
LLVILLIRVEEMLACGLWLRRGYLHKSLAKLRISGGWKDWEGWVLGNTGSFVMIRKTITL